MPLAKGKSWTYEMRDAGQLVTVTVEEPCRVGTHRGLLLNSIAGKSKLAWIGAELAASQLSAMQFDPPIILLKPGERKTGWSYRGIVTSRAKRAKATASITQSPQTLRQGGLDRETLRVEIKMTLGKTFIAMLTWFENGTGIVQQEQRNDGQLVSSLTLAKNR
jgi:hypothetical protein